ncbi:glycosyltransferase family 4 protein [Salinibacterium sp. ZJ70]|uniref:glycosyltransferase family 4 protein n=1 Tax=Salinibacterium sp. ZJ70 TaxID=2708084 RepID=UPI001420294B|nr:glycosyltransferase family 4 protein [Salinibacterium sp. ZJ70]
MRVTIISRVYAPEVSAASGILQSWAEAFRDRGAEVTVVTAKPPKGIPLSDPEGITVRRAPVIRDRQQYVRGYLSYMSFDIPLAFRLLFSRRSDLYVVEPPPTTVAVVRVIAALKRTPYVVDAADLWSDAAAMATDSRIVLTLLRWIERWGLRGARHLFAAHQPLVDRFRDVGIDTPATPIGFGADTRVFHYAPQPPPAHPTFVYAGTHSEWHGAGIFVDAFANVLEESPSARLVFIGNGQDREALESRAVELDIADSVDFHAPIHPAALAPILAGATASLASLKPKQGYDYAFTTKVYSSLAAGCPVIFAGVGPTVPFLRDSGNPDVGVAVEYAVTPVAQAMLAAARAPLAPNARSALSSWASERYSLTALASRVADSSLEAIRR